MGRLQVFLTPGGDLEERQARVMQQARGVLKDWPELLRRAVLLDFTAELVPRQEELLAVMEDLAMGQRITAYKIEMQLSGSTSWAPFSTGTSVGHKRIDVLSKPPTSPVAKLRLTVTDAVAPAAIRLSAFKPCPSS